jgi:hypothetical protein
MWKWLRNPTLANGLVTWYVSHRGLDSGDGGDGSATNPFKTIAQATSVATEGQNIMLDDGVWSQQRTLNNRSFKFWGNGVTEINAIVVSLVFVNDTFYFLRAIGLTQQTANVLFVNCVCKDFISVNAGGYNFQNCYVQSCGFGASNRPLFHPIFGNIFVNVFAQTIHSATPVNKIENNVIIGTVPNFGLNQYCNYNNYTTSAIPTTNGANANSINDASTGQTAADYFNNTAIGDYTAKVGSANLGAGFNRQNIGFGLGLTLYATDPAFLPANGAVLRNVHLVSDRFELEHRGLFIQSATDTTVVLHSSASAVDDYYNGLVFAILDGAGEGIMREILDYDGTTKEITVASLGVTLDPTTFYSISGRITSGVKDFGAVFKIARNHLFGMFGFNAVSANKWTEFAAINPNVASFGLKHSITDSLVGVDYKEYGFNGELLSDGTYGDADDDNNQANNKMQWLRTVQFDAPILIDFPL